MQEAPLRIGQAAAPAPASNGNNAVPVIQPVNIPAMQEFKLYGMQLWVTEKEKGSSWT